MLCGVFMKKRRSFFKTAALAVLVLSLVGILLVLGAVFFVSRNIDYSSDEAMFLSVQGRGATRFFYDEDPYDRVYLPKELCIYRGSGLKQEWVPYEEICDELKSAFIAAEDRRFFEHRGIDLKRTVYAAINHIFGLGPRFGASTITQQVIKNASGDNEQTVTRKISEIFRAIHIENIHTKEEIFEVYMNIVPMGDGILGVGMASEYYFGKEPSELTYAEAATLVGITNAPSRNNPRKDPERCKNKRNNVLYAVLESGFISKEKYEKEIASELSITEKPDDASLDSWFVETVCDELALDLSRELHITENAARILIKNGALSVYTTVDPNIQSLLEEYFYERANFSEKINDGLDFSMVILDSKSGRLIATVGGVGKKQGNKLLNNATVPHVPGSAMKPIALYAPLLDEKRINWATVFDDVPYSFTKNPLGEYIAYPKNYPSVYDGLTTVADALRVSKNTVAVRLCDMYGIENTFNKLRDNFSFSTLIEKQKTSGGGTLTDKALAPLALGQLTKGISLRSLTEAYTVFPSEGVLHSPKSYVKVFDKDGNLLIDKTEGEKRVFSKESSRIMNMLLSGVVESGTAKAVTLTDTVDTAGKTGTSGNDADRVFVGYTPYYTAGIWCGYNTTAKSIGRLEKSHIEIWDEIMRLVHSERLKSLDYVEGFSTAGLEYLPYCKDSGELFSENCLYDAREGTRLGYGYFTSDNKPKEICRRHVACYYDSVTGAVASEACPTENLTVVSLLDIPERSFPTEVTVKDAEYVWRKMYEGDKYGDSFEIPFYYYTTDEGEFVGRSKGKRQYNSYCYIHGKE